MTVVAALLVLAIAAVQTGVAFYVQGIVFPIGDVAAYQPGGGSKSLVAGPAADQANGTPVSVQDDR